MGVPGAFLLPPSYRRCSRQSRRVFARREGVNRYPSLTLKLSSTAASRQQRVACRRRSSANVPRSFSFFLSFSCCDPSFVTSFPTSFWYHSSHDGYVFVCFLFGMDSFVLPSQ